MGENGKGGTRKLCHRTANLRALKEKFFRQSLRHLFRVGAYDASRGNGLRGPVVIGMNVYSVGSSTEYSYFPDMSSDQLPVYVKSRGGGQVS